jgi:hypothetical protein
LLTESDKVLELVLPLGSFWLPAGLLCVGGILEEDEGDPPLRGDGARADDRVPELALPSPGGLLRGSLLGSGITRSTPEFSAAELVSDCLEGMALKICPSVSPNVAVLDPLPPPLSGTGTKNAIDLKVTADNLRIARDHGAFAPGYAKSLGWA